MPGIFEPPAARAEGGPNGFHWLIPALLGGMARPGLRDLEADIAALVGLKTRLLVSLTAEWVPDKALFARHGIATLHVPIVDFGVPRIEQAKMICTEAAAYIDRGEVVVFHCHAGKGRTGTMLAAMLIWSGAAAHAAIASTKARHPAWIETGGQLAFLKAFGAHLAEEGRG